MTLRIVYALPANVSLFSGHKPGCGTVFTEVEQVAAVGQQMLGHFFFHCFSVGSGRQVPVRLGVDFDHPNFFVYIDSDIKTQFTEGPGMNPVYFPGN